MNKHVEVVKKWLKDPYSVSPNELRENAEAADSAVIAAWTAVYSTNNRADFIAKANYASELEIASNVAWSLVPPVHVEYTKGWVKEYEKRRVKCI